MSGTPKSRRQLISDEGLRELSAGGWLLRFIEQYLAVQRLQAGVEDACPRGAIDIHIHPDPCSLIPRSQDFLHVAAGGARAGMRAVIRKDHYYFTVGEAHAVQQHIDDLVEGAPCRAASTCTGACPSRSHWIRSRGSRRCAFPRSG